MSFSTDVEREPEATHLVRHNAALSTQHSVLSTRLDWRPTLEFANNESIASILLKLEQVQAPEIAILAPPRLRVFRNPVAMRLLQRKAQDLGLMITIISDDEMTRQLCAEAGFGCYADAKGFRRDNSVPRHLAMPRPPPNLRWLSAAAGACLLALIGFVGWFVLPAASISVTPAAEPVAVDVPVTADASTSSVDLSAGKIPARVVVQELDGQSTVTASGQRDAPNQPAHGFVVFTNLTNQPITVPKSTVVLAGKIAFFTTQDTPVGASLDIGGTAIPGTGTATVQAADPGPAGNVPVGAITAIQGPLASKLTVLNKLATSGGSNKTATYLSAEDQAKAKQALLDGLRKQATDRIQAQIARNETFLPSPSSEGDNAIEELTYEESPEQVTSQTILHMKILVRGLAFQGDDVNQVVTQAMDNAVRQRGPDAKLLNDAIRIDPPAVTGNDGSTIKLRVHAAGRIVAPLNPSALADRVRGMAPGAAKAALLAVPGVGQADVQLWPAWAHKVPSFSWRIHSAVASPSS